VDRLQAICDRLGPGHIEALLRKWLKILPNPFTTADEAAGYRYELSVLPAEFSLTQMLDRPVSGRIFFEQVLHENLDIGRPDRIGLVFNRRIIRKGHHPTPGRFRTRVITDGVAGEIPAGYPTGGAAGGRRAGAADSMIKPARAHRAGPPTGVDPRNATAYSAITRPRIVGSVVSWTVVLPTARNDTLAGPDQGEHQQLDRQTRRCRGGQDEQLERCGPYRQRPEPGAPSAGRDQSADGRAESRGRGHEALRRGIAVKGVARQHRQPDLNLVARVPISAIMSSGTPSAGVRRTLRSLARSSGATPSVTLSTGGCGPHLAVR
jgi:hypothetical protein